MREHPGLALRESDFDLSSLGFTMQTILLKGPFMKKGLNRIVLFI